jgi:hypothetical protein
MMRDDPRSVATGGVSGAVARDPFKNFAWSPTVSALASARLLNVGLGRKPFDFFDVEPPIATNTKPGQFSFLEKPVDGALVDLQVIRQFFDG